MRSAFARVVSLVSIVLTAACAGTAPRRSADDARTRPNLVVIYADDLGYGDLGCQGAPAGSTPNLDRLAAEGVRLSHFYSAQPVCSASRAALLTGCYPNRIGIAGALGPSQRIGIADDETTLAELCRAQGYATAAFGKWHLGHLPQFLPTRHGFDEYFGIPYSNDMGPANRVHPDRWPPLPLIEGETTIAHDPDQAGFTGEFTQRAIRFMRRAHAEARPFFVYLAQPMPHTPIAASAAFAGRSGRGLYADVILELDAAVGTLVHTLEELGIRDDTLLVFASDNGPWLSFGDHAGSSGGLREGKGTTFEGGVRVPCIWSWPARFPRGLVQDEPAMTIDVLPTLAALLRAPLPALPIDGASILPLLDGDPGARSPHEELFFWYHAGDLEAMRAGRWKLHFPHGYRTMQGREPGRDGLPGSYDDRARIGLALFDLTTDPGERHDLAAARPELVAELVARADRMRARLGDRLTKTDGRECRAPGRAPETSVETRSEPMKSK
ncbi:MAG: sulfatase [Planctomycetes bacterium]|nr:sulfatase [Planctomycetota bacterium]